jgi:uncharacterized protein (DUF608 family)
MKLKVKGHRFDTIEEIQAESQSVFHTLIEKDFQEVFQKWRGRYMRQETTSRVMAADRLYGEFYDVYSYFVKYSDMCRCTYTIFRVSFLI